MGQAVGSQLARLVRSLFGPAIGAEVSIAVHAEEDSDVLELARFARWVWEIRLEIWAAGQRRRRLWSAWVHGFISSSE